MNNYLLILIYLLNKEKFQLYIKYIDLKNEEKEVKLLYSSLTELWEKHPERDVFSKEEYVAFVRAKAPDNDIISLLLTQILESEVGEDILHDLVSEAKRRNQAYEIATLAIDVSEGKKDFDSLLTKFSELDKIEVQDEVVFVTDDLEELYEHNVKKQGLRWRLRTLNEMLGSLRRGDFGFVFARPESGKTTFLASEATFFAQQCSGPVLWFNNEEQGEKVQLRCYQAALGIPLSQLFGDIRANRLRYSELTGNRIKIIDNASIHKRDVEGICEKFQPDLIIFDQIDKVKGFDSDREDLRLGSIYQWARELAKTYSPVIGVTQSDGSGEGKQWLTMENVANAKTAKQAEADWILGIGKKNDSGYEYVRHLHLSKNKLAGDVDTIPVLRHGRMDVIIKPEIARYLDVG